MATAPRLLRLRKRVALDQQNCARPHSAGRLGGAEAARRAISAVAARRRAEAFRKQKDAVTRYRVRRGWPLDEQDDVSSETLAIRSDTWSSFKYGPALIDLNVLDRTRGAQVPLGNRREAALVRAMSSAKKALTTLKADQRMPGATPTLREQPVSRAQMCELWELYANDHGQFREQQMQQLARDVVQLVRHCLHDAQRVGGVIAKRKWQWNDDKQQLAMVCVAAEAQLKALEDDPAGYLWQLYPSNVCFLARRSVNEESSSSDIDRNISCSACECSQAEFVNKAASQLFVGGDFDLANLVPQVLDRLVCGAPLVASASEE